MEERRKAVMISVPNHDKIKTQAKDARMTIYDYLNQLLDCPSIKLDAENTKFVTTLAAQRRLTTDQIINAAVHEYKRKMTR